MNDVRSNDVPLNIDPARIMGKLNEKLAAQHQHIVVLEAGIEQLIEERNSLQQRLVEVESRTVSRQNEETIKPVQNKFPSIADA